jgi:hypothetical protein
MINEDYTNMRPDELAELVRGEAKVVWQTGGDWGFPNHAYIIVNGETIITIQGGACRCFHSDREQAKDNKAMALAVLIEKIINDGLERGL